MDPRHPRNRRALTAIQSSSGKVTLQIHDLQGDVVETASDLESETKILTSYRLIEINLSVEFKCIVKPSSVDVEVQIWIVENGKYVIVYAQKSKPLTWVRNGTFNAGLESCTPGSWYRGWAYASVWAFGTFVWSDSFVLQDNQQCYEQGDGMSPGEAGIEGDETPEPPDH
jgi:hypothetical protein